MLAYITHNLFFDSASYMNGPRWAANPHPIETGLWNENEQNEWLHDALKSKL